MAPSFFVFYHRHGSAANPAAAESAKKMPRFNAWSNRIIFRIRSFADSGSNIANNLNFVNL
jgi:hypothetical protein